MNNYNDFTVNQIIFHLDPLEHSTLKNHHRFDIFRFSKTFGPIRSGYVQRRFTDLSYKISTRLHITLHLRRNIQFWVKNLHKLHQKILKEIHKYITPLLPKSHLLFTRKLVNIQGTFPANESNNVFRNADLNLVSHNLNSFFKKEHCTPLIKEHHDVENPQVSRGIKFSKGLVITCYKNKCSFVTNSVSLFKANLPRFLEFQDFLFQTIIKTRTIRS